MTKVERPTIYAVDFDGTLVKNEFPGIGEPNKKVVEYVRERKRQGDIIILWTTRKNEFLDEALQFCQQHNIPIDYANENVPWLDFETSSKIFADVYIDDRGYNPFGKADNQVKLCKDEEILRRQNKKPNRGG